MKSHESLQNTLKWSEMVKNEEFEKRSDEEEEEEDDESDKHL